MKRKGGRGDLSSGSSLAQRSKAHCYLYASRLAGFLIALLFLAGCSPEVVVVPPNETKIDLSPTAVPEDARITNESWDAVFIQKHHVGFVHLQRLTWGEKDAARTKWRSEMVVSMKRNEQTLSQRIEFGCEEDSKGRVLGCDMKLALGEIPLLVYAKREGDRLLVETTSAGRSSRSQVEMPANLQGFFAAEESLLAKPLEPGEERKLAFLFAGPGTIEKAEVVLRAKAYETTPLLEGPQELLRIEFELTTSGQSIKQTVWMNRRGETQKTYHPAMQQYSYRTSRERALAGEGKTPTFDVAAATTVRVKLGVDDPHATKRAVYRVRLSESDPAKVFRHCASQAVKSLDAHRAELTITAIRPGEPARIDAGSDHRPGEKDLLPNQMIESDDPRVVELAENVAHGETDPWKIAGALERLVRSKMQYTAEAQAFATAAEVARSFHGDCTEHGVLLAALLRARKIPSRVAIGLVYHAPSAGFAYHLWTEAWIGDRWVPLDATLARGGIGAAHLKITDSNLDGASAASAFLPVIQVIGQMEVEVVVIK